MRIVIHYHGGPITEGQRALVLAERIELQAPATSWVRQKPEQFALAMTSVVTARERGDGLR